MKTTEVYQQITEKIIANLETAGSWQKMWAMPSCVSLKGHVYSGINRLILAADSFTTPVYGTFDQIRSNGGHVRKGEKATMVVFWKRLLKVDEQTKEESVHFVLRNYYVFNVEQADFDDKGKELITKMSASVTKPNDVYGVPSADNIIDCWGDKPQIIFSHKDDRAYYAPMRDLVSVPDKQYFKTTESFYCTLFHELVHSTGHRSRLNRFESDAAPFGSVPYSKEELVAELGASFLCAVCNIENDIVNSAAYIAGWSRKLRDNPGWIVTAASKAEQAAEYVLTGIDVNAVA